MAVRFQLRRDTAANWNSANPVLALGEPGVETDTLKVKIGDGVTVWTGLDYTITTDFTELSNLPITLSGYGITDAATSAQGALADSAVQPGDSAEFSKVTTNSLDTADSSAITVETDLELLAGLTVGNHIIPSSNENIDLGSPTNGFRELYLSGNTINLGGTSISAEGGTVQLPLGTKINGLNVAATDQDLNTTDSPSFVTAALTGTGAVKIPAGTEAERPAPEAGQLRFNTDEGTFEGYDGAEWGAIAGSEASFSTYRFTATDGQTTFSGADDTAATLSYTAQNLIVTLNGVVLEDGTDYTATNGTSIVLAIGAALNDELNVMAFTSFSVDDTVSAANGGTFTGGVSFSSTVDINGGTIDGTVIGGSTPAAISGTTGTFSNNISVTGNITVSGSVDGRDIAADGSKLDGVEDNADVTDATNVEAAGALMDSELTDIAAVKALDQGVATTDSPSFVTAALTGTGAVKIPAGTEAERPAPEAGQLRFNTDEGTFEGYDGAEWGAIAGSEASFSTYRFTATDGQTTFSGADDTAATLSYTAQNLIVTLNGVVLEDGTDYTASNGTSIVLSSGAALNDELNVMAFTSFSVADTVSAANGGTFTGSVSFGGTVDINSGTIDGTVIGGSTPAAVTGTTITATGDVDVVDKITHTGDTDTAIRFPAADTVTVETAGSERVRINSSGRVGIGTNSPNAALDVAGEIRIYPSSGTANLRFGSSGSEKGKMAVDASSNMYFETANLERMRIDSSGNVGIGTSLPATTLDVNGNLTLSGTGRRIIADMSDVTHANRLAFQTSVTNGATSPFFIPNGTGNIASVVVANASDPTNSSYGQLVVNGTSDIRVVSGAIGTGTQLPLTFNVNAVERMRIATDGKVGIATSNPAAVLQVNDSATTSVGTTSGDFTEQFRFYGNNGNATHLSQYTVREANGSDWTTSGNRLQTRVDSTYMGWMQFNQNGAIAGISFGTGTDTSSPLNVPERMRINGSGQVGIGTNSPAAKLHISGGNIVVQDTIPEIGLYSPDGSSNQYFIGANISDAVDGGFQIGSGANIASGTTHLTVRSSGNVGIGTSIPANPLDVLSARSDGNTTVGATFVNPAPNIPNSGVELRLSGSSVLTRYAAIQAVATDSVNGHSLHFLTNAVGATPTEKMRITSSGNVGIGTSSPGEKLDVAGSIVIDNNAYLYGENSVGSNSKLIGRANDDTLYIGDENFANPAILQTGNNFMAFHTNASERMRITDSGAVVVGKTTTSVSTQGSVLGSDGRAYFTKTADELIICNRLSTDGSLIRFFQDDAEEGQITVSGSTVSYNGGHLSRWSQTADNTRIDLLKGTVMTNLDQMAVWGDEDNEQLNCMAVSSVEGDPNVAGVFVNWDDDDETYTADMNIAMTGDMIIRIGAGVTVERGDLLMSAGDGTAKPQGDDIVRSKTIAKVTSTHVTCTYEDGSYCVPCVLMAC